MPAGGLGIAAAAQGIGGLISGVTGFFQRRRAKRLLKGLAEPIESIPSEVLANQQMAKTAATTGLPSQEYNLAKSNILNNQANTIQSAQDRRGALDVIPSVQANTNKATLNLDASNANARMQNQKTLMDVNNQVAGWKDKVWDNNVRQKYLRNYQYAMQMLGAGGQNLTSGLDSIAAAGLLGFGGGNNLQTPNYA